MNRDEQLFLSETLPVHDTPLVSLDESAEVLVVPNDSNDNPVIVTLSATNTTMATTVTNPSAQNTNVTTMATAETTTTSPPHITTRPDHDILPMGRNSVLHGATHPTTEPENPPEPDIVTIDHEKMELEADSL